MRFLSESGTHIVQVGKDLLVVNRLAPYVSFDEWVPVVEQMISHYLTVAQPTGATQVGVRYINRIDFNEPRIQLERFFGIYPELPTTLGDEHGPFMVRLELPISNTEGNVLITLGSAPPAEGATLSQVLDLYARIRPIQASSREDVMTVVRKAQEEVERAFEGTIKTPLRELFGQEVD